MGPVVGYADNVTLADANFILPAKWGDGGEYTVPLDTRFAAAYTTFNGDADGNQAPAPSLPKNNTPLEGLKLMYLGQIHGRRIRRIVGATPGSPVVFDYRVLGGG